MEKVSVAKNSNVLQRDRKPFFQARLTVGPTDDVYEKEADAMADKVMRMADTDHAVQPKHNISSIQRMCAECQEEEEQAQRKESGATSPEAPSIVQTVVNSGGGTNLDTGTRGFMENRFGYDFSNVKIHNDTVAAKSAQSINALAYTSGNNIVFNQGQYSPGTNAGKKLLAHELTHVVQQDHGGVHKKIQRISDATFEAGQGVGAGITAGTMTPDGIMGQSYSATCRFNNYDLTFRFSKAYKGVYPYRPPTDIRGVYVKIEVSINDRQYCGRCTPLRLLQTLRNTRRGTSGNMEAADPLDPTRRERSGWSNASAPSRGWRVDTLTDSTQPFYSSMSHVSVEGSETTPAILYDIPGDYTTTTNAGKDFYTCAVCQTATGRRWVAGCVNWGYYIDASSNIVFLPATPVATCGSNTPVQDASERWDSISGNTRTGIGF
jgi:hypothetical protein